MNRARVALECIIIGDDHAAFARGHQLAGLKAECASRAEGANALTAPLAGMGVRGVLDQRDPFVAGEVLERVQVRGMASHVDGNNGFGAGSNCGGGCLRIEAVSVWEHVNQDRQRVGKQHGAGSGNEGEIGNDDFIAGIDSERCHGHFQGGGAIGDRYAVANTMKVSKCLFEFQGFSSRGSPPDAAFQNFSQSIAFSVIELWPQRKRFGFCFLAAEQRELGHLIFSL